MTNLYEELEDIDMEKRIFFDSSSESDSDEDQVDHTINSFPLVAMTNSILEMTSEHEKKIGGSVVGHRVTKRNRINAENTLNEEYFCDQPIHSDETFRQRFRMRKDLFLKIVEEVASKHWYFQPGEDAVGNAGFSARYKVTAAIHQLIHGTSSATTGEQLEMGEATALESMKYFCEAMLFCFSGDYLRKPNQSDIDKLLAMGKERGFPGMLGSICCVDWEWKHCPKAWRGKDKKPTLILEAVASHDHWIWHPFFNLPGTLSDIDVFDRSFLYKEQSDDDDLKVEFEINGKKYNFGYYLADEIYPNYPTLVKTISDPQTEATKHFAMTQESVKKDAECAFELLKSRFAILSSPARLRDPDALHKIMKSCIIMHNMILEDEKDKDLEDISYDQLPLPSTPAPDVTHIMNSIEKYLERYREMMDEDDGDHTHVKLRNDLVEELWKLKQNNDKST